MTKSLDAPLLTVQKLVVRFPVYKGIFRHIVSEVVAVNEVSFSLERGKVLGLVGESGSGKSTVARAIMRLVQATAGEITFEGIDLLKMDVSSLKEFRKHVQIVFQDPYASLNPRKTVGAAIQEVITHFRLAKSEKEIDEKCEQILDGVGLSKRFHSRYPHELSGGQQQRVCIGRALLCTPKLLILDEAVSSLDISVRAQILNLLMDLKEKHGLSYLFISHDLSVIRHLSDSVLIMQKGKMVETGSSEEIFTNPKSSYTKELLQAIPQLC